MQGRQRPPQVLLGERTRPYGVWSICAHPITGVNPYSRRYCLHQSRGKGYFPLDWCKAGNAHRRCLGERTRPYGVWSICAHPITGVNPYSRRYCLPVKRGKVISPLDWCKAGNAHRRCPRRAHKTIRSVVYLCAPHNWGEPILPEILLTSQEGERLFPLLTGARQATPTAGALGERTRPYECGLSVRTP